MILNFELEKHPNDCGQEGKCRGVWIGQCLYTRHHSAVCFLLSDRLPEPRVRNISKLILRAKE